MIPRREPDELRGEWSLDIGVIEKDYVSTSRVAGTAAGVPMELPRCCLPS